jgi:hypothetical protein
MPTGRRPEDSRINNHLHCDAYPEAENPIFVA